MRLTTKKKAGPRGLAAVCSGHPGYEIKIDGVSVGGIYAHKSNFDKKKGWYYVISSSPPSPVLPYTNTSDREIATWEEAKAEAFAFIRKALI